MRSLLFSVIHDSARRGRIQSAVLLGFAGLLACSVGSNLTVAVEVPSPSPAGRPVQASAFPAAGQSRTAAPAVQLSAESERMITQRVAERVRYAFGLAQRGAIFSSRQELREALKFCTLALDAQSGDQQYSTAVREGLTALSEADGFAPSQSRLESRLDVQAIVNSHRTTVLKGRNTSTLSAVQALQIYYDYAQDRLVFGCGKQQAAGMALYGLAKVNTAMASSTPLAIPKAMALYQTVMIVDPNNYLAANELGVLLAQHGRLADAETVLRHAVVVTTHPEPWANLAKIYERTGRSQEAAFARARHQEAVASQGSITQNDTAGLVRFVSLETFVGDAISDAPIPAAVAATRLGHQVEPVAPREAAREDSSAKPAPWLPTGGLKRLAGILRSDSKRK